ncbi:hypothetical protein CPB86DRAFT_781397 [Serendipita vermifera]|nr:hypothetical protein CPB86DRAFT_781397 [Serendipita vermifera]
MVLNATKALSTTSLRQIFNLSICLTQVNRTYRQSVFQQQQKSTKLSAWHDTVLPDRLEAHQQQSEDIKKTITKIFTYQSDLYVKLVNDLGLAKDKTQEFSSSGFISEAFESQQLEAGHLWMQPASYMDLETGESSETVIFGTDKEREVMSALLNMILEGNMSLSRLQVDQIPRRKETIKLEQQFRVTGKVNDTLSTLEDRQLGELFCLIGLSQSPLVPIQDDEVKRYAKNPVPRDKIQPIMDRAIHRRLISDLMTTFRAYGYLRECCTLLTHRAPDDVKLIMLAISDKWDFESHRPLPKRVLNKYEGGTEWNLWGKTGGLYDPSRKDSY